MGLGMRLERPLTSLALCWRVVRRDGVALGFTSHDRPLLVDGLWHESAPGMSPSAVELTDGLEIDTMEVAGALSSRAIAAVDLLAGRYDGAAVTLFLVDWRAPDAGRHALARGLLGTVEAGSGADAGFVATMQGPTSVFGRAAIESYSPECRADLGDARCTVALRGRMRMATVVSGDGVRLVLSEAAGDPALLVDGVVRVLDGAMAGTERRMVAADAGAVLVDAPLALTAGTRVRVVEGCDKRFVTCVGRFANAANFRGEPHVPGGDLLTRIAGL